MGQLVQRCLVQMPADLQPALLLVSPKGSLGLGAVGAVRTAVQQPQVDQPALGRAHSVPLVVQVRGFDLLSQRFKACQQARQRAKQRQDPAEAVFSRVCM